MIKAIFFDIDNTLFSHTTHHIPESTITAIHALKQKDILLFTATGRPLSAAEAKEAGLAYQVVPKEELEAATMKFAAKLAAGPLISYKNMKKQMYEACYKDYADYLSQCEIPTQRECAASMDFQEGVKAFMEKRKAVFEGR